MGKLALALLVVAAPVAAFVPPGLGIQSGLVGPVRVGGVTALPRSTLVRSSTHQPEEPPRSPSPKAEGPLAQLRRHLPSSLRTALFTLLALSPLAASLNPADAAPSGGRVGGQGFRSAPSQMRRYAAPPSSSYSPPPRASRGYVERVPMPVPVVPYSPFGGFGGFGYGISPFGPGIGVTVVRPGPSLLDIVIFGALAAGVISVLSNRIAGSQWSADDDEPSSLGTGVTVLKLQVGLQVSDRSSLSSILGQLDQLAKTADVSSREGLAQLVSSTCMAMLRCSGDWVAAHGESRSFGRGDGMAQAEYQRLAVRERSKFDKEEDMLQRRSLGRQSAPYLTDSRPTLAVVTLCVAIRGSATKIGQVSSMPRLREALQTLAADAITDDGRNVLATEVLWTPQDDMDVLTKKEMIQAYPELIDL